jgi:hypothetical protein
MGKRLHELRDALAHRSSNCIHPVRTIAAQCGNAVSSGPARASISRTPSAA